MATLRASMSKKKGSSWTESEKASGDYNRERNIRPPDTPLAAQLQQAWLQTQLPKRSVPKLDFLSPLPSSPDTSVVRSSLTGQSSRHLSSSSFSPDSDTLTSRSDSGSYSPAESSGDALDASYRAEVGSADVDTTMDDPFLSYISDMLMEEDLSEKPCMFVECSAYQAITEELEELIREPAAGEDDLTWEDYPQQRQPQADNSDVKSWVDGVLDLHPWYLQSKELGSGHVEKSSDPTEKCRVAFGQCAVSGREEGGIEFRVGGMPQTGAGVISGVRATRDAAAVSLGECPYLEPDTPRLTPGLDYSHGRSGVDSLAQLYPLLIRCAEAVAQDNVQQAHYLISRLREVSGPSGDGGQRMAHYFVEALVAKLSGTGGRLYTASVSNTRREMLKAYMLFVQCIPLPKIAHYYANKTIYDAIQGDAAVHIVDFGILYGAQWPCLLQGLAKRPGGPPRLRITGIDFPQPGFKATESIEETGRRLADKARALGLDFEYQAIAGKWEQIQPSQLNLRKDEVLIVNSVFRLRHLLDETVMASSPRKLLLSKIHSLNPKLFVTGVVNAGYNTPFFLPRFREAVSHYSAWFDAVHSAVPPIPELRLIAEKEVIGRAILNIVACEGVERLERAETFTQWQSRITNAGFKQQQPDPAILEKAREILRPFHKDFGMICHGSWVLTGWKDRVLHALTAWKP